MTEIVIVGGGYAGYTAARTLQKQLRPGEAEVTLIDARPYMTYQPFLPEVAGSSIESRHVLVPLHRTLKHVDVVVGEVTGLSAADKSVTVALEGGTERTFTADQLIVTLGAVSRTFPIPGIADNAIGLKSAEEAEWIRDRIITNFERAEDLPDGPDRHRLLTFVVVGAGFAGVEGFSEMLSLSHLLLKKHPSIAPSELQFHIIDAAPRIMPEVSEEMAASVVRELESRGAHVHLSTQVSSAEDGVVVTSEGESYPTDVIVWTAGQMANPVLKSSDLPLEPRGRVRVAADLRVTGDDGPLEGIWAAGDSAQVPDASGSGLPDGSCVPNAQHAVRQGRRLARNVLATLRGELPIDYFHKPQGAVAGLGVGRGVFTGGKKKFALRGFTAWVMHRGYHGLAIPTWDRKIRVFGDWIDEILVGRDLSTIRPVEHPKAFFRKYASCPRPAAEKQEPAAEKA
ncbi:MAG: NAD(P)/FAD-dependent oxidoreductase [Microbacteriaceae bacterium]|nr:NAD(P)/FAD-dependent oxidoreductase [Microbacteriaceae bacterium]